MSRLVSDHGVAILEWTWTVVAVAGVMVCLWALADGYLDRARETAKGHNGLVQVILTMNLRTAHASGILHTFFLGLGVVALMTPDEPLRLGLLLTGLAYIVVAATNVRALLLNQIDRVRIRRMARVRAHPAAHTISESQSTGDSGGQAVQRKFHAEEEPKPEGDGGGDAGGAEGGSTEGGDDKPSEGDGS